MPKTAATPLNVYPDAPLESSRFPVVQHLLNLRKQDACGPIAIIRRGLQLPVSDMMSAPMARHIWPYVPTDASYREKHTAFLVSALFAGYCAGKGREPEGEKKIGNFGATMRKVWKANDEAPSFETCFAGLLDIHSDNLIGHLRQLVLFARAKSVPVDWDKFYEHLRAWNHVSRFVQRQWAESFWRK